MTVRAVLLLLFTVLLLPACADKPLGDALFPLAEGHRWTYRVNTAIDEDGSVREETLTLANRGLETIDGGAAWKRRSDSGIDYWHRSDASGIYRVAAKGPLDVAPQADNPRRYVLRQPLAVGTAWEAPTLTYVLARKNEVPHALRHVIKPVPMNYRVAALAETVQTPAGRFENCVRVDGRAEIRLYVDALFQWRQIPLEAREWYCPGVGLVKLERKEPSPTKFMVGGTVTMELVAWQ